MTVYRQAAAPLPKNTHCNNSNLPLRVSPKNRELLGFSGSPALTIQGFKLTKYTKACQSCFSGWKASMWWPHSTVSHFFFLPPGAPWSKCFDSITAWNKHPSFTVHSRFSASLWPLCHTHPAANHWPPSALSFHLQHYQDSLQSHCANRLTIAHHTHVLHPQTEK